MAGLELGNNPESRRRYEYLAGRVNSDHVDYFVPVALRRNFGFPIDFSAVIASEQEGEIIVGSRFDVMTDGVETAARIAEISELVIINSGVSMLDDALKGNPEKVYPAARGLFREQFMKVPRIERRPSLANEDIYRLFVKAFKKKYLEFGDRSKLATTRIEDDEMRHFYNSLIGEYGVRPMDGDRVIIIVTAMIKNILDVEPGLRMPISRTPQG